ncbi:MAG: hypothetical protein M3Y51_03465 [Actinomycetota bacterium]|nr:hypothetical protein [Actinomycetota bacterium]
MPFRSRRTHVLASVVVASASLLLAACGDQGATVAEQARSAPRGDTAPASTTTLATATPATALREAVRRSAEQPTYRMSMVMTADGRPVVDMTSATTADGRFQESTLHIEPMGDVTMLIVDGAVYYRFPDLPAGKEWVHLDAASMSELTGVDPTAFGEQSANTLRALEQISDEVEHLGTEDVDGVAADHYRYTIDVERLMADALASGGLTGPAADAAEMFDDETQMNVWVGPDGLVRRVSYELTVHGVPGGPSLYTYEMTFSDHGLPVQVTAPPPETTISMDEFMMGLMTEGS